MPNLCNSCSTLILCIPSSPTKARKKIAYAAIPFHVILDWLHPALNVQLIAAWYTMKTISIHSANKLIVSIYNIIAKTTKVAWIKAWNE
jgi:hypothetical protein